MWSLGPRSIARYKDKRTIIHLCASKEFKIVPVLYNHCLMVQESVSMQEEKYFLSRMGCF